MNGGMKMISADGKRVLERNDPEIQKVILTELNTAENVEIVSTGSRYSLIVRVSLRAGLFRDDLVGEDDALMHGDERWLPTTGKPIKEVILKFILISSSMREYTYDKVNDKCTMLQPDVIQECMQQRDAFDATKHHVPVCPDFVAFIPFLSRMTFDEIFANINYKNCRVFQKLRTYFSLPFKPQVAMIVMESIPASYVPLKTLLKGDGISHGLIEQICAMYVVLFHTCSMIALDAHWSNWLVDESKPPPLGVKLIDFGMCLDRRNTDKIIETLNTYFERHPTEVEAYLKLMGATPGSLPCDVMIKAIQSVHVPIAPMESWIHKILVISMLIDGFFNMNHSTKKTCQMKHAFNVVYNDACVSMSNILQTLRLDLPTYLALQQEKAPHIHAMLHNMASYMETYYSLRPRTGVHDAGMDVGAGMHEDAGVDAMGALPSYGDRVLDNTLDEHFGGKKMKKRNSSKRKRNKKKSSKSRKNKMHRK
jgi:hypothetical protein